MTERGSVTYWMLGLAMCIMTLGVLSVDLWNLMSHRRELAAIADAAAVAAVSALDEASWRSDQVLALDEAEAERRASSVIAEHLEVAATIARTADWIEFHPERPAARISLTREVETTFLGLAGRSRVTVGAASEATAVLRG